MVLRVEDLASPLAVSDRWYGGGEICCFTPFWHFTPVWTLFFQLLGVTRASDPPPCSFLFFLFSNFIFFFRVLFNILFSILIRKWMLSYTHAAPNKSRTVYLFVSEVGTE